MPAKIITAVVVTGDTIARFGRGEITTQECIIELGERGLNFATTGYSMAVGQAVIPIPIVGAAVGALVGSILTSSLYNQLINTLQTKESLEKAQYDTEQALLTLGYSKKGVLEGSMKQFLFAFNKIKNIQLRESTGLNELSKFSIDTQDVIEIQKMTDIYESSLAAGAAGAAAGTVIALAASGSLPIVTGVMSTAAMALSTGSIEVAAGLASSALSFGAAMTPLTAIAAPVLLFTGISSSIKADENLEKAHTMYAEAELAVVNMKHSVIGLIITAAAGIVLFCIIGVSKKRWNLHKLLQRILSIVVFSSVSLLLVKLLSGLFGMPSKPAVIIGEVIFVLGALFGELVSQVFDNPISQ